MLLNNIEHVFLVIMFAPIVFGSLFLYIYRNSDQNYRVYQKISLLALMATSLMPIALLGKDIRFSWLPSLGINFSYYIDNLSFILIIFTNLIFFLYSLLAKSEKPAFYFFLFVLQLALFGIFTASNLVVFYFFYELLLLPCFYLMYVKGSSESKAAAFQFLLYTVFGSLLMLVAISYLGIASYQQKGVVNFDYLNLLSLSFSNNEEKLLMLGMLVAFAIKAPIFPFHGWLPALYSKMPHRSAIIVTALLFQSGLYGIYRFVFFLFPEAYINFTPALITLAVIGIVYSSLIAWKQETIRGVMAYASIAHVGFSVVGFSVLSQSAIEGALILIISHVLIAAGLFTLASILEGKTGTGRLSEYQGLADKNPRIAFYLVVFSMASISLPLTLGFVGEFKVLAAAFKDYPYHSAFALIGVIFGAVYMLKMSQQILFGEPNHLANINDLDRSENSFLAVLMAMLVFLGVFPGFLSQSFRPAAKELLKMKAVSMGHEIKQRKRAVKADFIANRKKVNRNGLAIFTSREEVVNE